VKGRTFLEISAKDRLSLLFAHSAGEREETLSAPPLKGINGIDESLKAAYPLFFISSFTERRFQSTFL
jgi:hypothetical protein